MSWLEALQLFMHAQPDLRYVSGATVHKESAPKEVQTTAVDRWAIECRPIQIRGGFALHLYPS